MKDSSLIEEDYSHATSFSLAHFGPEFLKQTFYVSPLNVRAHGMRKDRLKNPLMLALHVSMVPQDGTVNEPAPVALLSNVRHERRRKGREAAFGTSARWRG